VKCYGTTFDDTTHTNYLVLEYLSNGSLFDYLFTWKKVLTSDQTMEIAIGIANGINFVHKNHYVHGDISSQNILLSRDFVPKLCDFAFTERVSGLPSINSMANLAYAAPETDLTSISFIKHKEMDIFSFGLVLWELFALDTPIFYAQKHGFSVGSFTDFISKGNRPKIPENIPRVIQKLIAWAWHQEPDKRPSIYQVQQVLLGGPPELFTVNDSELNFG